MHQNSSMAQLSSWTDSMNKNKAAPAPRPDRKRESDEIVYDANFTEAGRELRANSSIERMETWTGSMQKNQSLKTKSPAKGGDDEYADEEFEDYDEDFEADETEEPAPVKVAERPAERPAAKAVAPAQHVPQQIPLQAPAKIYEPDEPIAARPQAKSSGSRAKQFDNVQMSLSSIRMTDPRGIRVQKLLDSKVMELQLEKATIMNVLPSTPYELYQRNLRLPSANVRQMGVPVESEKRDMEVNTDVIDTATKSVQFSYGDDTVFYRTLDEIRRKKGLQTQDGGNKSRADREAKSISDASDGGFNSQPSDGHSSTFGATRLATFLQRASRLCEHVLDQQSESKESEDSKSTTNSGAAKFSIFDSAKDWVVMGTDKANGGNEPVRTRKINCIKFSALQPHLMMTAHPYPADEQAELDLKPYKGLYCVWDAGNAGGPQYVLESTGQPTACCFSATQAHFLLAGTLEGSLHLWDLREDSSLHKDRDALDLRISRGIRKPCYSTSLPFLSLLGGGAGGGGGSAQDNADEEFQHSAPVVAVEALSPFAQHPLGGAGSGGAGGAGAGSVVSQFVSIDEAGVVIFWVTSEKGLSFLDAGNEDTQKAPWGTVALVQTRQIHTHSHALLHRSLAPIVRGGGSRGDRKPGGGGGGAVLQGALAAACIPHDLGTLLVSGNEGVVCKVSRYGDASAPTTYARSATAAASGADISVVDETISTKSASINDTKPKSREVRHFSAVSCMAVRPASVVAGHYPPTSANGRASGGGEDGGESKGGDGADGERSSYRAGALSKAPLLLVGRFDGSVDLFHMDSDAPLQTWELSAFSDAGGRNMKTARKDANKVVLLQWCATRPAVFFATDAAGNVYHFDLHVNAATPVGVETVGVTAALTPRTLAVSQPRPGTGNYFVSLVVPAKRAGEGDALSVRRGNSQVTKSTVERYNAEEARLYETLFQFSAVKASAPTVAFVPAGAAEDAGMGRK